MITVFTLSGKKVLEKAVFKNEETLDISGLLKGIYLVKVDTNEGSTTQKLVVR